MSCLLFSSYPPTYTYRESILSIYHIEIKVFHKKTNKTPYKIWEGRKPNLDYLKVWGSLTKVMLPKPKNRKLDSQNK